MKETHSQLGLTLLEMMVVLLIAGMAMALGFQSLSQWRRADAAISSIQGSTQERALIESWLRSSIRSLVPIEQHAFSASSDSLEGVSASAVLSHQGGASHVSWKIDTSPAGVLLTLIEDEESMELLLRDSESANFKYMDTAGTLHAQWPPKLGLSDHLPPVVLLEQMDTSGHRFTWAVNVAGALNPVPSPFEPEDD